MTVALADVAYGIVRRPISRGEKPTLPIGKRLTGDQIRKTFSPQNYRVITDPKSPAYKLEVHPVDKAS